MAWSAITLEQRNSYKVFRLGDDLAAYKDASSHPIVYYTVLQNLPCNAEASHVFDSCFTEDSFT